MFGPVLLQRRLPSSVKGKAPPTTCGGQTACPHPCATSTSSLPASGQASPQYSCATISDYKVCPCTDISLSSEIVRLAIFRDNERNPPSCAVSASCDFPES